MGRGYIASARAIIEDALATFPTKRSVWMLAVELERKHGTPSTLDEVLAAASKTLPRLEIFWLLCVKDVRRSSGYCVPRNGGLPEMSMKRERFLRKHLRRIQTRKLYGWQLPNWNGKTRRSNVLECCTNEQESARRLTVST
jgi:hypothetical protein